MACEFRHICVSVRCSPHWHALCALQCSSTCAGGFQRRVVVCQDADGRSNSYCDERVKPAESKSCDSGPCPLWNYGVWGEVRTNHQVQNILLVVVNLISHINSTKFNLIVCYDFSVCTVCVLTKHRNLSSVCYLGRWSHKVIHIIRHIIIL